MPQIKTSLAFICLCLGGALALSGCGDRNSQAVFESNTGKHLANWLPVGHKTSARADLGSCFDCHGENLDGGISKVSCTRCHLGSLGAVHPVQWGQYAYARHADYLVKNNNDTSTCANAVCHGPTLAGVPASGPACATACHIGGASAIHPTDWRVANAQGALPSAAGHADFVTTNGTGYNATACSNAVCHGTDYRGVFLSGPSCFLCHPADPTDAAPLPDKHPHQLVAVWMTVGNAGFHGNYLQNVLHADASSCLTNFCHGAGGTGPSCSTVGCHP
jgi:hypothetical protein